MDTKKQIQNILKYKYKTIGHCIQFMKSWRQGLNNFGIIKVGLKLIRSKWCSNLLHIKILIYYDLRFMLLCTTSDNEMTKKK